MSSSAENQKTTEDLMARFMERLGEQDAEGIGELFADEIDWYVPGSQALPWTGPRSRREHVAEYFRTMWPAFVPGQSTATVDKIVIGGDDAVVFASFAHMVARNGKRLNTPAVLHLTVANRADRAHAPLRGHAGRPRGVLGLTDPLIIDERGHA